MMLSWTDVLLVICLPLSEEARWEANAAAHRGSHPLLLLHGVVGRVTRLPLRA